VLVPFLFIEGPAAGWLRDLGLLDRDEQFTELSFRDRAALPKTAAAGSAITFDIEVHNVEGEAVSYRWQAVVSGPADDVVLDRGRIRLDNGEARRIPVVGQAPASLGPATVRVTLVAREESIDFPVTIVAVAGDAATAPG
jgi:uncharacterized protein YfaS (alpha-2-macroglobulin family)